MPAPASRMEVVERNLEAWLATAAPAPFRLGESEPIAGSTLTAARAVDLFEDMATSRFLDICSRELKKTNRSFYTIGSSGHEWNACVGALLRLTDPCLLHYRAGGLMMARSRLLPGATPIFDTLLSFAASAEDPISRGRHKVWGSRALWVPPQTSTIASHLPKAVGMAFAIGRGKRLGLPLDVPYDSIVLCSFGDASANHATAQTAFNAARYIARVGNPCPILFLCEDNGIGISVPSPDGWIAETFSHQPGLAYFRADGEFEEVHDVCSAAIEHCRRRRAPVFLHLRTVRLFGHAGTDVETAYRPLEEIEEIEADDPLLRAARRLVETGCITPHELRHLTKEVKERVFAVAEEACSRRKLESVAEIVAPLAPYDEPRVRASATASSGESARRQLFGAKLPEEVDSATKRTLAAHVNSALHDEMLRRPEILAFGEDVGRKGGVYYVTADLQKRFGVSRCFDTLLDETTILGVAQGAAQIGFLPIPEIQYLAYVHNALDQLRGEACSLSFFSAGQFTNPMVVRVQGLAYQKGFGGHFHNDNSIGALRDIPGLAIAIPARGDDAARLLRGCVAMAKECGRVVVFLEPIALYHERDLYEPGDGKWLFSYPPPGDAILPGEVGVYDEEARDVLLVTYGNGVRLCLRAAREIAASGKKGLRCRVLDLRWINPLPFEAIRRHAAECAATIVVDECRETAGGVADSIVADLATYRASRTSIAADSRSSPTSTLSMVKAVDTYVPLGAAANLVLVSEQDIVARIREVVE